MHTILHALQCHNFEMLINLNTSFHCHTVFTVTYPVIFTVEYLFSFCSKEV